MITVQLTAWVVLACALLLGTYAAAAAAWGLPGATVSESITRWSKQHPMIPFALGVLVGHWLW
jgi:hypothetical protein